MVKRIEDRFRPGEHKINSPASAAAAPAPATASVAVPTVFSATSVAAAAVGET